LTQLAHTIARRIGRPPMIERIPRHLAGKDLPGL
jgi:hypothetical protein